MKIKLLLILSLLLPLSAWADKPIIIGVSGGTASGKTTLAKELVRLLKEGGVQQVALVSQDSYYMPLSQPKEHWVNGGPNYDHPSAIDFPLIEKHLKQLQSGGSIDLPEYDWITSLRKPETTKIGPSQVVVFEGIHALHHAEIRAFMDLKVFVQYPADLRLIRRIKRDTRERGQSAETVIDWYLRMVRPMHDQFIEPTAGLADLIYQGDANVQGAAEVSERVIGALAMKPCEAALESAPVSQR